MKSSTKVQRRACRSLLSGETVVAEQVYGYVRSGLRLQRKQNQNKHLFAPPPPRFLNYRVGPRGAAHARQGTALPVARKYVGKISATATTIADANQSKQLRRSSTAPPANQRQAVVLPGPPSQISKSALWFPAFLFVGPVMLVKSLVEALTRRRGYRERTAWSVPRTIKAPPLQATNLNTVTRTGKHQHSQITGQSATSG